MITLAELQRKLDAAREDLEEAQANHWRQRELALECKIEGDEDDIETTPEHPWIYWLGLIGLWIYWLGLIVLLFGALGLAAMWVQP